jgi:gliding motility-associated lipoprotein GldH
LKRIALFFCVTILFIGCKKINIYEKRVNIPSFKWDKKFVPSFQFDNSINNSKNEIFVIIRHTNNYPYSNIWVNLIITNAKDSSISRPIEISLSNQNQNKRWANDGMDDIYEVKYPVGPFAGAVGEYTFKVENIMRDNPMPEVLSVGIRIAKAE